MHGLRELCNAAAKVWENDMGEALEVTNHSSNVMNKLQDSREIAIRGLFKYFKKEEEDKPDR